MVEKIDKKFIITQTIIFIFIVGFIVGFKIIFGDENILIGVTSITAIMMFLGVDLTSTPIKNTLKLLFINLLTGVAAYFAVLNPWLGIPINLIVLFIIGYNLYYNLKSSLYIPFSLQYLFLIATPVEIGQMPIRLASLLVTPIGIMLLQMLLNRNRVSKKGNVVLEEICDILTNKISKIEKKESFNELNKALSKKVNEFRKIVYDNRRDDFYLTEEARIKVNISVTLEKISSVLDKVGYSKEEVEILPFVSNMLQDVKKALKNNDNLENTNNSIITRFEKDGTVNLTNHPVIYLLNCTEILTECFEQLKELGKENYNKVIQKTLPEKYSKMRIFKRDISNRSVKFSYAVRSALGISLAIFLSSYFKIPEGKWIYFTALSLIIPIYELSKKKMADRFLATIIGSIAVVILFSIFKDMVSRTIILMVAGYMNSYFEQYKYKMTVNTISAIGAAALMGGAAVFSIERVLYVIFGSIIAIIFNKIVFPVKIKDANDELQEVYINSIKEMIHEVNNSVKGKKASIEMKNLLLVTSMIEEKLAANNDAQITESQEVALKLERLLIINLFELQQMIVKEKVTGEFLQGVSQNIELLKSYDAEKIDESIKTMNKEIENVSKLYDKLVLVNVREIMIEINCLNKMRKTVA